VTFVDFVPCRDYQATITITYNGVLHFTVNKAGDFWATGTMNGSATVVPLDPSNPSFTGHFTMWFGESDNKQNGVALVKHLACGIAEFTVPARVVLSTSDARDHGKGRGHIP
jgi:hypothetical protein